MDKERLISGERVMVTWSKDNDELRAFSHETGKWTVLKIEKQEKIVPVADGNVVAVRVGKSVAAYSGKTGRWSLLPLNPPLPVDPVNFDGTFTGDLLQIKSGDHLYTFPAGNGRWTSPTDPEFQESQKTIKLLNNPSGDLQKWIDAFSKHGVHGQVTIGANVVRINAYRLSWLKLAEAKIAELDVPGANPVAGFFGGENPARNRRPRNWGCGTVCTRCHRDKN